MIFFLALAKCTEYYIKIPKTDLYLQGPVGGINATVFFHDRITRNRYKITLEDDAKLQHSIKVVDVPGHFLDVSNSNKALIYFPLGASAVQTYELRPEKGLYNFRIANKQFCATWNEHKKMLVNELCTQTGINQIFTFICANCYKKANGEIAIGKKAFYDLDRTSEGFYDNNVISMLHAIENMSHEFTDCFAANSVCSKQVDNHPLLCFSPFSDVPAMSGDWSSLKNNAINYHVNLGDKEKAGSIKLNSKKVQEILDNDNNKTCFDSSEELNCKGNKYNIHGKGNSLVNNGNSSKFFAARKLLKENYAKEYTNEIKALRKAISKFKSSIERAKTHDHAVEDKLAQLIVASQEKHMLPQYSDIMIHDSLHQEGEAEIHEQKDLEKFIENVMNSKEADDTVKKDIMDYKDEGNMKKEAASYQENSIMNENVMESAKIEEHSAIEAIMNENKTELEKIDKLKANFLTEHTSDEICRLMYTEEYCDQLQHLLLLEEIHNDEE